MISDDTFNFETCHDCKVTDSDEMNSSEITNYLSINFTFLCINSRFLIYTYIYIYIYISINISIYIYAYAYIIVFTLYYLARTIHCTNSLLDMDN